MEVNTNPVTMLEFKKERLNFIRWELYFLLARTYKERSNGVGGVCVSHRLSSAICK